MKSFVITLAIGMNFLTAACEDRFPAKDLNGKGGKAVVTITTTVADRLELPECNDSSQNVAAYIAPVDHFVKCSKGRWRNVSPGSTATNYTARSPFRYYEWEDTASKKRWSIPMDKVTLADDVNASVCSNGWKLPTRDELVTASNNGLIEGIKSHGGRYFENAWTNDFQLIGGISQRMALSLSHTADGPLSNVKEAGVYCISFASNS
ncbi:MAG: hypothetical protein H7249_00810 [Chitinophagaceae bacterium]|nr:hypothetical protein [Oligoflexus sp.]